MITDATPVRVGGTDLFAPRVGLGTAVLGNFLQAISDADAVAVISHALASGVRYVDTAPLYGHGLAEQRTGMAIAGSPHAGLVVSTKVGRLLRAGAPRDETQYHDGISFYKEVPPAGPMWDFSYDGVRQSVEESLERTGRPWPRRAALAEAAAGEFGKSLEWRVVTAGAVRRLAPGTRAQGATWSLRISLFVEIPQLICCGISTIMAGPPAYAEDTVIAAAGGVAAAFYAGAAARPFLRSGDGKCLVS